MFPIWDYEGDIPKFKPEYVKLAPIGVDAYQLTLFLELGGVKYDVSRVLLFDKNTTDFYVYKLWQLLEKGTDQPNSIVEVANQVLQCTERSLIRAQRDIIESLFSAHQPELDSSFTAVKDALRDYLVVIYT